MPLVFEVTRGGGTLSGQTAQTVLTDGSGQARIIWTLGPEPGVANYIVLARVAGMAGLPAAFVASGVVPGPPDQTRVSGVVLDHANVPMPGVTATIEGTALRAVTDAQGQFTIPSAPAGAIHLRIDGSTTSRPGSWPYLEFALTTVAGTDNTIGMPIFLLPLDTAGAQVAGGAQDVTVSMKDVPGFGLTIFANSATFADGSRTGPVTVTQVHHDKVPMPPIAGAAPRLVWTVQPAGVVFDPPARITYPNVDGLRPGQVIDIFSFDHDLGLFVSSGTGTVSPDGAVITSDPGSGITKAGWGYPAPPPPPPGCVENVAVAIASSPAVLSVEQTGLARAEGSLDSSGAGCPPHPGGTYAWTTDDPSVLSVAGAGPTVILTGLTGGQASIVVTYGAAGAIAAANAQVSVAGLSITSPINSDDFDLSEGNFTQTLPISFKARLTPSSGEQIRWTARLQYETSGGRGRTTQSKVFSTQSDVEHTEVYSSIGGRITVSAEATVGTQTVSATPIVITVTGVPIPDVDITNRLVSLYTQFGGATPRLMTGIASRESSYRQFAVQTLLGRTDLWPLESFDGGSHIGLMMVPTTPLRAWDWGSNTLEGSFCSS